MGESGSLIPAHLEFPAHHQHQQKAVDQKKNEDNDVFQLGPLQGVHLLADRTLLCGVPIGHGLAVSIVPVLDGQLTAVLGEGGKGGRGFFRR